ncbi:flagellar assembly peptidoglycan hydrolase FlgJ [Rheinheimera sp. 4Y26]|uniref:flagellar assembly peptidoglycan hydrolase FlgJ n=1 Tax=Rheinheimera sp. 4Y26 TaxID=2977811 RepID=UPI0021B15716|nr:flagellar assembly peptidoglycan hydrolase FlgJ [Rheinheimera sp. 4Y26]MCT6700556.1 flagellar assembly peptidoglycan hydrolase FlgJ [Rheinheimera sp. 4Y26]
MNKPDVSVSYHDLSSLNQLRSTAKKDETASIKQAAQQFESVFMGMLLSSMRKANESFGEDNPLNSQATEFYRDMHDSQLATELSKKGALGLADLMVQQLSPEKSKTKAASHISPPSRFDVPEQKNFALPSDSNMHALESRGPRFVKLDPERIVLNASPVKTAADVDARGAEPLVTELPPVAALQQQTNAIPFVQQLPPEQQYAAATERTSPVLQFSGLKPITLLSGATTAETLVQTTVETKAAPKVVAKHAVADVSTEKSADAATAFIQKLLPAAEQAAAKLGLEPLALIAQAALETGWGQRMFKTAEGQSSNNLFGIKAMGNWQGNVAVVDTLEYRQGVAQKEKAKFRAYDSTEQSLSDYVDLIQSNPRYQAALEVAGDTKAYFRQLQAAGYATDPNYAEKILSVLQGRAFKEVRNLLDKSS